MKSVAGKGHSGARCVSSSVCLSGPAVLAIFCSLALVLMLWCSQTGTVDSGLSAKADYELSASFFVANLCGSWDSCQVPP